MWETLADLHDEMEGAESVKEFIGLAKKLTTVLGALEDVLEKLDEWDMAADYGTSIGWVPPLGKEWVESRRDDAADLRHVVAERLKEI